MMMRSDSLSAPLLLVVIMAVTAGAFQPVPPSHRRRQLLHVHDVGQLRATSSSTGSVDDVAKANRAKPRTGLAQSLLNFALASPLWKYVLVPQARANIAKTAESNGVRWNEALRWIKEQDGPWKHSDAEESFPTNYPDYYVRPFHAYDDGNLSWDAAFEQELAGRAVGARNFPQYGEAGDDAFRGAFEKTLDELGAIVPQDATIVDLGCGTGTSTRRLAEHFPQASEIIGIDLSPYFIAVGRKLLELAPMGTSEGGPWVTTIKPDTRIDLRVGDAASTNLPDACAYVVCIGLVVHELPLSVSKEICKEAKRILKPGGQLCVTEMDFDSPAFSKQRANPLLFSLIRSTEPYLDEYADGCDELREFISNEFQNVRIGAATGRHYALVATKGTGSAVTKDKTDSSTSIDDRRFNADGTYAVADTHLMVWETSRSDD